MDRAAVAAVEFEPLPRIDEVRESPGCMPATRLGDDKPGSTARSELLPPSKQLARSETDVPGDEMIGWFPF